MKARGSAIQEFEHKLLDQGYTFVGFVTREHSMASVTYHMYRRLEGNADVINQSHEGWAIIEEFYQSGVPGSPTFEIWPWEARP